MCSWFCVVPCRNFSPAFSTSNERMKCIAHYLHFHSITKTNRWYVKIFAVVFMCAMQPRNPQGGCALHRWRTGRKTSCTFQHWWQQRVRGLRRWSWMGGQCHRLNFVIQEITYFLAITSPYVTRSFTVLFLTHYFWCLMALSCLMVANIKSTQQGWECCSGSFWFWACIISMRTASLQVQPFDTIFQNLVNICQKWSKNYGNMPYCILRSCTRKRAKCWAPQIIIRRINIKTKKDCQFLGSCIYSLKYFRYLACNYRIFHGHFPLLENGAYSLSTEVSTNNNFNSAHNKRFLWYHPLQSPVFE